jgi:hypothetical protein
MDCALYDHSGEKDAIECHSFGLNLTPKEYSFIPNIKDEDKTQNIARANQPDVKLKFAKTTLDGIEYAVRVVTEPDGKTIKHRTMFAYTMDSYREYQRNPGKNVDLVNLGKLVKVNGKYVLNTELKDDFKQI